MFKFRRGWYFSPDGGGSSTGSTTGSGSQGTGGSGATGSSTGSATGQAGSATGQAGSTTEDKPFEDFLKDQPEEVRKSYEKHITGLKNTVTATREERDGLSKQIKELLPKAEKGSEIEQTLLKVQTELDNATKRANFAEDAIKPEIGCSNIKAAFALATAEDLFDKRGNPDWNAIRLMAPEFFKKPVPDGDGGSGSGTGNKGSQSMDEFIRARANK